MDIRWGKWDVEGTSFNRKYKIIISARAPKEKFMDLKFMLSDGEYFHDYETLTGDVYVKLFENKGPFLFPQWKILANVRSHFAGLEYGVPKEIE